MKNSADAKDFVYKRDGVNFEWVTSHTLFVAPEKIANQAIQRQVGNHPRSFIFYYHFSGVSLSY